MEYLNDSSLLEDIEYFSDKSNVIHEIDIKNMIIKYIYCYYHLDLVDLRVPFSYIEDFFNNIEDVIKKSISKSLGKEKINKIDNSYNYQIKGIVNAIDTDFISKSIEDIIYRDIKPESFDGMYLGMSLGNNIGLLAVAQGIQAKRNNFESIRNINFEQESVTSCFSDKILRILNLGESIKENIYSKNMFNKLPIYQNITFISNTKLPKSNQLINKKNEGNQPFIKASKNIFTNGIALLDDETGFHPDNISIKTRRKLLPTLNRKNHFSTDNINSAGYLRVNKMNKYNFSHVSFGDNIVPLKNNQGGLSNEDYIYKKFAKTFDL